MKEFYHIFSVYDYKGGELSSNVNLTKEKFLTYVGERFESFGEYIFESGNFEEQLTEEDWTNYENNSLTEDFYDRLFIPENMDKYLDNTSSIYAGGGDDVSEWYVSKNNKLESYGLSNEDYKTIANTIKQHVFRDK